MQLWAAAGTIGAAAGPALGGFLTQLFSWRSIFLLQAPLAAIALVAVFDERARAVERPPRAEKTPAHRPGEPRVPVALRRARRRAVPRGAAARRRVGLVADRGRARRERRCRSARSSSAGSCPRLSPRVAAGVGGVRARRWARRARVPSRGDVRAGRRPPLAACGLGLGLLGGVLGPAAVPPIGSGRARRDDQHRGTPRGLRARARGHRAGAVGEPQHRRAARRPSATTAEILDSPISLRTKVSLALDLRDLVADAPRGEVPDPTVPFDERGAATNANMRDTRDGVVGAIRDTHHARLPVVVPHRGIARRARGGRPRCSCPACPPRWPGAATRSRIAAAIVVLVVVLVAAEFRAGARDLRRANVRGPVQRARRSLPAGQRDRRHAATHLAVGDQRRGVQARHQPRGTDPVARAAERVRAEGDMDARHARGRAARRARAAPSTTPTTATRSPASWPRR